MKEKVNLPNYYFDLSVDQQAFINALLEDKSSVKIEQLKTIYKKASNSFNELSMTFDKIDSIMEET